MNQLDYRQGRFRRRGHAVHHDIEILRIDESFVITAVIRTNHYQRLIGKRVLSDIVDEIRAVEVVDRRRTPHIIGHDSESAEICDEIFVSFKSVGKVRLVILFGIMPVNARLGKISEQLVIFVVLLFENRRGYALKHDGSQLPAIVERFIADSDNRTGEFHRYDLAAVERLRAHSDRPRSDRKHGIRLSERICDQFVAAVLGDAVQNAVDHLNRIADVVIILSVFGKFGNFASRKRIFAERYQTIAQRNLGNGRSRKRKASDLFGGSERSLCKQGVCKRICADRCRLIQIFRHRKRRVVERKSADFRPRRRKRDLFEKTFIERPLSENGDCARVESRERSICKRIISQLLNAAQIDGIQRVVEIECRRPDGSQLIAQFDDGNLTERERALTELGARG